ncbi:MAG: aspartate dehydrogenase [Thiotrichales bacterium]|nr:aspartate dehydrogenase [Thiotrichales bacterium]MCY4284245.1 aspartate dehydrogenase [Thiotrichales bacterium]
MISSRRTVHVAVGGLGTVGFEVARRIDGGAIDDLTLSAVSARDHARARARMRGFRSPVDVVAVERLADRADIVVESAPAAVFREIAEPVVRAGKVLVAISAGALLDHADLVETARATGAQIVVPSGAVMGLDAVRGAAESGIASVTMITRKPPGGLAGAPHLVEHGIDVGGLETPLKVFEGSARDGARGFPANVNVAAALGLAGVGPERTRLEIWADPGVTRNTHEIRLEADTVRFQLRIENVPSEENPRTGRSVAPSVVAALRRFVAPLVVGT